ncbi:uncharacterized protein LOC126786785 [Argentina anserina]|uniref:uncharacterized protein LOC126786785 n=1 Tax=Argentina anserina TaxID=57926 RepID=UPI0021766A98|nr:uncharacterized protein LOC126786785 [Potentilla anserina]XP_050368665.1 uncharacterized protein LOC126786785 [Potentilla anserina]
MSSNPSNYSCETAAETLRWINAIADFVKPFSFLTNAHVVNFFNDTLWEAIDKDWMDCLRQEPLPNLLQIPSGLVQDHWPASLREFIVTLRSLSLPRQRADLPAVLPGMSMTSLNSVLSTGMNSKKKHEVEVLSAVVSSVANSISADAIIDVGAGQGYLAQVLSFHYQHSVIAIDSCSHHGNVTNARAEQIKKHYAAQMRKSVAGNKILNVPKTITCNVMSIDMLKALTDTSLHKDNASPPQSECNAGGVTSLVLAGLHACGDLSVTMLKTFMECEEVKAVISVGCCYNLLSEEGLNHVGSQCGFPMSRGVKSAGLSLGKSSRDLACQSAERWSCLENDAGLQNFELHTFRAAFQMVLSVHYPEVVITSPSIGRQGKALRRQQHRGTSHSLNPKESTCPSLPQLSCNIKKCGSHLNTTKVEQDGNFEMDLEMNAIGNGDSSSKVTKCEGTPFISKYPLFEKYCLSGFCRLGLQPPKETDLRGIWNRIQPFAELIGPYWTLRAALGPLLETLLLLDRLLFLQEKGSSVEVVMLPIFDPALSPRNVAIIAKKLTQI